MSLIPSMFASSTSDYRRNFSDIRRIHNLSDTTVTNSG